jgi:valyl-tRNA synthetase
MIDKTYQPSEVEGRIYRTWEQAGAFTAGRPERAQATPYSIVIPPPNVTGSLHMGHALNNTLQDVLCRFERMRGKDVLWQPGTDHAGIATQMVVERQLAERKEPGRREMGREAFLKRVWEWKAESGGTIVNQLKRLGASCDWSRERFTMDPGQMSQAVIKAFVDLYTAKGPDGERLGLIYKDKRLVNWDPKLLTAISDLEVVQVETKGHLWHLKYPLADGMTYEYPIAFDGEGKPRDWEQRDYIVVATTRPETMLGDTAVAVHPNDARYQHLVEKKAHVILPLVGRRIPIIADTYSDPSKGSGAVKITPAHDFNDFEVGKRHKLQQISVLNAEAKINLVRNVDFIFSVVPLKSDLTNIFFNIDQFEPSDFRSRVLAWLKKDGYSQLAETMEQLDGVERFAARKQIVGRLQERELVADIETHHNVVPHGDRSNVVVEPYLTEQWYVNAEELAKPAIAAVRDGKTKFIPENWEKTYFDWMEKIQPWCISRQLWWGHHIPCWYGAVKRGDHFNYPLSHPETAHKIVVVSEAEALKEATKFYGGPVEVVSSLNEAIARTKIDNSKFYIWRDEDVLDTWFSSALWPLSTLGWPDATPEVKRFYPTDALVTGFDIIFFWVARMMMMGLHFMPDVPFRDVYIHRLVRDASGAKMSKSKGNVVDPLGVIDDYGADALRFTLARGAAQGHDIRLGPQDVENNRNFATKLWNAARFAEMNGCASVAGFDPKSAKETLNRWIAHETAHAAAEITAAIEGYKFNDAAAAAYRFVWNIYCDWYLELAKPVLLGADGAAKRETQAMVAWARDEILKLLHPFMPFITEELWAVTGQHPQLLALSDWPSLAGLVDEAAEAEIGWLIDLVTAVRSIRAEMNITAAIPLVLAGASAETGARTTRWAEFIKRLARVSEISSATSAPQGSVQLVVRGEVAALPLKGVIDLDAERARLAKEMQKAEADIARVDGKLGNANFVARAPEEVVEEEKEKRAEAVGRKAKIAEALERLKGAA